jgi:hypothetical protein
MGRACFNLRVARFDFAARMLNGCFAALSNPRSNLFALPIA